MGLGDLFKSRKTKFEERYARAIMVFYMHSYENAIDRFAALAKEYPDFPAAQDALQKATAFKSLYSEKYFEAERILKSNPGQNGQPFFIGESRFEVHYLQGRGYSVKLPKLVLPDEFKFK
jgi:outer membrane protein assembly factor BamD (BamD/ComL family)